MATKIRNVSGEPLQVPELGWRTVQPDELVEVPDDRVAAFVYQDAWDTETPTRPTNKEKPAGDPPATDGAGETAIDEQNGEA